MPIIYPILFWSFIIKEITTFAICTCHLYIGSIKVYSITGLDRSLDLLKSEAHRISRQSAHEGD